jgi:hypothetical protein
MFMFMFMRNRKRCRWPVHTASRPGYKEFDPRGHLFKYCIDVVKCMWEDAANVPCPWRPVIALARKLLVVMKSSSSSSSSSVPSYQLSLWAFYQLAILRMRGEHSFTLCGYIYISYPKLGLASLPSVSTGTIKSVTSLNQVTNVCKIFCNIMYSWGKQQSCILNGAVESVHKNSDSDSSIFKTPTPS